MLVDALLALANLMVLPGIGNTRLRSAIRVPSVQGDDHGLPADRGAELLAGHAYSGHHAQFAGALEDRQLFFGRALVLAMKNHGITVFSLPARSLIIVVVLAALAPYCSRIRRVDCDLTRWVRLGRAGGGARIAVHDAWPAVSASTLTNLGSGGSGLDLSRWLRPRERPPRGRVPRPCSIRGGNRLLRSLQRRPDRCATGRAPLQRRARATR